VVVQATLRAAVGVAARPAGGVDRVDRQATVQRVAGQHVAQPLGIQATTGQGGIRATPAAPVDWLQAQVGKRRDRLGAQQCVSELQQGVAAAGAAGVQLSTEGLQLAEGGSRLGHDRAACPA
jgi:hypothetical protein